MNRSESLAARIVVFADSARALARGGVPFRRGHAGHGPGGIDHWKPNHLRGAALVAGWGREMLFSIASAKAMQMESAGRDGFFRWSPGEDRLLQTDPWGPVVGVDRDASADHVTLWKPER